MRTPVSSKKPAWLAVFLICAACLGAHCGDIPAPSDQVTDLETLIDNMSERLERIQSARFQMTSEVYTEDLRGANLKQIVLVRQETDIHVQLLDPFNQPLQIMVNSWPGGLRVLDYETSTHYYGSSTGENMSRFIPFYLTPHDVVRILLGGPPLTELCLDQFISEHNLSWNADNGVYEINLPDLGMSSVTLGIRHDSWTMAYLQYDNDADGTPEWEIVTGDIRSVDGEQMPYIFRVSGDNEEITMVVESVELNAALDDALFVLPPPPGMESLPLDPDTP